MNAFYRIHIADWLNVRAIKSKCLLSSGRLDEAREECDAGLKEAAGSKERIVRIALGSMRAQVMRSWGRFVVRAMLCVCGCCGLLWIVVDLVRSGWIWLDCGCVL